ncbi:MAG: DNA internalization-related competence protein ComEC/Rec2 [Desulfovibrio sp.]|uniref:DNA internalization-related competence protein ComEC/Rec2 n=1 Tax=Desulfovibrio sp. 7SRBS1 TaxID=3378064 RepID=UPI003B3D50AC
MSGLMPGPLFRQLALLAYAAGIFSLRAPLPSVVCILLVAGLGKIRSKTALLLLAAAFGLGAAAAWVRLPTIPEVPQWVAERPKVQITGTVHEQKGLPDNRLRIVLSNVQCTLPQGEITALPGLLVWTWQYPAAPRPAKGQIVSFRARVMPIRGFVNPEGWDTRFYWRCKGAFFRTYTRGEKTPVTVRGEPNSPLGHAFRSHLRQTILQAPGSPGRALLLALLTGDRSDLYASTVDVLRQASLAHSLALSGLHLGIAASLGFLLAAFLARLRPGLLLRIPRPKLGVLLAAPIVLGYLWLGGFTPSLVRAAVMFAAFGLLLLGNRPRVLLDGLFLALAVLLLADPLSLFELGLQMSFLAVAGIAALVPILRRLAAWVAGPPPYGPLRTAALWAFGLLGCSLAANLALFPLCLEAFGQIPLGLWWNLLWLPILGVVAMPLGFFGLLLASLASVACIPGLGGLHTAAAFIFQMDAQLLDGVFQLLSAASRAGLMPVVAGVHPGWTVMLGYYLFATLCLIWLNTGKSLSIRWQVAALCLLAWPVAVQGWDLARPGVSLTVLDVGQGQSLLIKANGNKVLIDGGGTFSRTFDIGEAVIAPNVAAGTGPRLRAIALTHAQRDHSGGLVYPMRALKVGSLLLGSGQPQSHDLKKLHALAALRGIPVQTMRPGETLNLGHGVRLLCVYPAPGMHCSDPNDCSLTFVLQWDGNDLALLPGDLSAAPLEEIMRQRPGLRPQILVLPHHGSDTGACPKLYDQLHPLAAIASCGSYNRYNFPGPGVTRDLQQRNIPIFTTAAHGAVRVQWDRPTSTPRISTLLPTH